MKPAKQMYCQLVAQRKKPLASTSCGLLSNWVVTSAAEIRSPASRRTSLLRLSFQPLQGATAWRHSSGSCLLQVVCGPV